MATPRKRRIAEALDIKAAAMRIIEAEGAPLRISGIEFLHANWNGLNITYTPQMPDVTPGFAAKVQQSGMDLPPDTPRVLDISQGRKVFSIRWNDSGLVHVSSFHRGDWESKLAA